MAGGNGHVRLDELPHSQLAEMYVGEANTRLMLEERLWELELALEDEGWLRGDRQGELEFSREAMERIIGRCRLFFLQNPLINHAVQVQQDYVFAQGVNITGNGLANEVKEQFWGDPRNVRSFTSNWANLEDEKRLLTEGNIFYVLFTNPTTGRVVVRHIPVEHILAGEIVTNPQDKEEVWYYRRRWRESTRNVITGNPEEVDKDEYYPDWQYRPRVRVLSIGGKPVRWDSPVYHLQVGGIAGSNWGIPELYSGLAWSRSVVEDLNDYATMRRAASRYAHKLTVKGGAPAVSSAKKQMETSLEMTPWSDDSNPPPTTGSTWVQAEGMGNLDAAPRVNTGTPEDGRRLGLMVSAAVGIPETILFGNADVGNLATASTLDRPTELKFRGRQELWATVYRDFCKFAIMAAARAPKGLVKAGNAVVEFDDEVGTEVLLAKNDAKNEKDGPTKGKFDPEVEVTFPDILQRDPTSQVAAIISAATLDAKAEVDILPKKLLRRLLMEAVGVDDVDKALEEMEEQDLDDEAEDILNPPPVPPPSPFGTAGPGGEPPPEQGPGGALTDTVEARTLRGLMAFQRELRGEELDLQEHPGHGSQRSHGNWATGSADSPFGAGGPPKRMPARDSLSVNGTGGARGAMHDQMIEARMKGIPTSASPTAYMTGGGTASGKSTAILSNPAAGVPGSNRAAHMDPDGFKYDLPEYGAAKAAGRKYASAHVHEESSYLAKEGLNRALKRGHDVVYDSIGDSGYAKLSGKVQGMRAAGAKKVVARYATVDTKTAIARSRERAAHTGRHVPETVIRKGHADVSRTVVSSMKNDLFDDIKVFDTGGVQGSRPVLIASKTKGTDVKIYDAGRWAAFVAKGSEG